MPSRRQFAKKGEEVRHFRLVARSQNDSRGEQDGATPLVLEPVAPPSVQRRTGLSEAELLSIPKSLQDAVGTDVFGQENNIEESEDGEEGAGGTENIEDLLDGDCYFPKDGYNYEKHLKRVSGVGKGASVAGVVLVAPSTQPKEIFAQTLATTEEEVEVIRALENDNEYEELDDGDVDALVPAGLAVEETQLLWGPKHAEDDDLPDLALFKEMRACMAAAEEATGSAVAYGEENGVQDHESRAAVEGELQGKDFAKFMVDEYAEEEVGACDDEEIEGHVSLENCEELLDEFLEERQQERRTMHSIFEPMPGKHDDVPRVIEETKAIIENHYKKDVEGEAEEISSEESEDESKKWDCETVLSTLSNLSNRPGRIGRIKLEKIKPDKKPGVMLNPVREGGDGAEEDEQEDADNCSGEDSDVVELPDVNTNRVKGETAEERRQRKAGVKEMRRICRKMKKESKELYKAEAQRLPGQVGGPDIRAKLRVLKL